MQSTDYRVHTRGRRGRGWLRVIVTVVSLGFLLPATAVAATGGALTQQAGTAGCVSAGGSGGTCLNGNGLLGAGSVAVSPDGKYVYVASFDSSAVTTFGRNTTTGGLSQLAGVAGCVAALGDGVNCGQGRGLNGAIWVAISPDGQHLYVASRDSNAVAVFARNPTTGVLTQLSGPAGCIAETGDGVTCSDGVALKGPRTVVVSPDGKSVYVGARDSDAVVVLARNPTTGALTQLSGLAGCVSETGTGGSCTDAHGLLGARSVAVSPDNRHVYVAAQNNNAVVSFARNTTTGALTQLPGLAGCIAHNGDGVTCASGRGLQVPAHVEVSPDGKHVYVASRDSHAVTAFRRDMTTGALTQLSGLAGCIADNGDGVTCAAGVGLREAVALTLSLDGTSLYVASQVSNAVAVFSRNRATGELTQLSGVAGCISETGTGGSCTDGHGLLGPISVAVSPDGLNAYAASYLSHALTIFTRAVVTHSDEVIIDFGPGSGIWVWQNNSTWQPFHAASAQTLVTGDLDGNGQAEVIIDFGPGAGIWVWQNNSIWRQLHAASAQSLVTGDLDGNGQAEVIIDFGPGAGIWVWQNNSTWRQLHATSAKALVTGDLDDNGQAEVIIDFGPGAGIWVWQNNSIWRQLHAASAQSLVTGDLDGNGQAEVIIDFGPGAGIWVWQNNSIWRQLHATSAQTLVTGDLDGNGQAEVIIDFGPGAGIWVWQNNSTWRQLHATLSQGPGDGRPR